jgi:hypothetical protein
LSVFHRLESELAQAREAMKTWDAGARQDKVTIDQLKAELEKDKQLFEIGGKAADMLVRERDLLKSQLAVAREALEKMDCHCHTSVIKHAAWCHYWIAQEALTQLSDAGGKNAI